MIVDESPQCPKCSRKNVTFYYSTKCDKPHILCNLCYSSLYTGQVQTKKCYSCALLLLKKDYVPKDPIDWFVSKEVEVREQLLKIYNKKAVHFKSLDEYDDYLEEIEYKVHILTDTESTEEQKREIKDQVKLEKNQNSQRIANLNAHVEEQLKLLKQISDCHQLEYRDLKYSKELYKDEPDDLENVKKMLESFDLDNYGTAGIKTTVDEDEHMEEDQAAVGANQNYIHKVHEIQQLQRPAQIRVASFQNPDQTNANYHRKTQVQVSGQAAASHSISSGTLSGYRLKPNVTVERIKADQAFLSALF